MDELDNLYDDEIISRFKLNEDAKAIEKAKIINLLKQDTNAFYLELNQLQSLQNRLNAMYPKTKEITEDTGFDWGTFAKNFGAGALSVVNPLIGVPWLAANFYNAAKKNKVEEQFIDDFNNSYSEYLSQWDKIGEANQAVYNKQVESLKRKIQSFLIDNSVKVFKKLDERGQSLRKAKEYVDNEMEEVKKIVKKFEGV
ncbi:MAG: hypothetical protein CV087_22355 [Candidatus Brocadia sp. WS118]|nr:MAG: hypothetical protein CV087_22355 [Candidatus Brocadia sp. WS118]